MLFGWSKRLLVVGEAATNATTAAAANVPTMTTAVRYSSSFHAFNSSSVEASSTLPSIKQEKSIAKEQIQRTDLGKQKQQQQRHSKQDPNTKRDDQQRPGKEQKTPANESSSSSSPWAQVMQLYTQLGQEMEQQGREYDARQAAKPYTFDKFKEFGELNRVENGKLFESDDKLTPVKEAIQCPSLALLDFQRNDYQLEHLWRGTQPIPSFSSSSMPLDHSSNKCFTPTTLPLSSKSAATHYSMTTSSSSSSSTSSTVSSQQPLPKVTILLTSFKEFGLDMLPSWYDPLEEHMKQHASEMQLVHLSIAESWMFKFFTSHLIQRLSQRLPTHCRGYLRLGECNAFRTQLGMRNTFVGYTHLIDAEGRVRWRAVGEATDKEIERLKALSLQLLTRHHSLQ